MPLYQEVIKVSVSSTKAEIKKVESEIIYLNSQKGIYKNSYDLIKEHGLEVDNQADYIKAIRKLNSVNAKLVNRHNKLDTLKRIVISNT